MSQTNPVETFVDAFFEKLIESNAVNYLQETYGIEYPVLRGGKVDVTVILNYPDKPTPHELLLEAKAEVERLKRNIRVLEKASGLVIPDGRDISEDDYPVIMKILKARKPSSENMYVLESPYGKKVEVDPMWLDND